LHLLPFAGFTDIAQFVTQFITQFVLEFHPVRIALLKKESDGEAVQAAVRA